jgi:DNA-binding transcriptional LysR family regulator
MTFELSELRYFFHVATTRSFAEGAKRAHVSAPTISKAIKRLEDGLGTQLLRRTTRKVTLTDTGEIVLAYCRRVLRELDAMQVELDDAEENLRGELRIGTMEAFSNYALPRALTRLTGRYPDVVPQTYLMAPQTMEEHLLDGKLDVGLSVGNHTTTHVEKRTLIESPGSLVCGRGHPLYDRGRITAAELQQHGFVVPRFFGREHLPPVDSFPDDRYPRKIAATVELLQMAIELVVDGRFLGFFPDVGIRCQINHGELRRIEGLELGRGFELCALLAPGNPPKASVRELLRSLEATLHEALSIECAA